MVKVIPLPHLLYLYLNLDQIVSSTFLFYFLFPKMPYSVFELANYVIWSFLFVEVSFQFLFVLEVGDFHSNFTISSGQVTLTGYGFFSSKVCRLCCNIVSCFRLEIAIFRPIISKYFIGSFMNLKLVLFYTFDISSSFFYSNLFPIWNY